jgi:hypothetical protein
LQRKQWKVSKSLRWSLDLLASMATPQTGQALAARAGWDGINRGL